MNDLTFIIKKIGQNPPIEINPNKEILRFLNKEDKSNYKKGLICISQNYGIGAFAYFRRIVENEIKRIIEYLAKADIPDQQKIKELLEKYKANHQMSNLIDGVFEFLPSSLKGFGDNPLKLLYSQLSGGIHEFSDNECFDKAQKIETILSFVIIKLNEEKSEVSKVRNAMNTLKNK